MLIYPVVSKPEIPVSSQASRHYITTSQTRPTHHMSMATAVNAIINDYFIMTLQNNKVYMTYLCMCHYLENYSNVNTESLHFAESVCQMLLN